MTAAVVSVPADQVIAIRYARRVSPLDLRGHLLTRTWEEGRNGSRPAVCGVRSTKWKSLALFADADRYWPCHDCTSAAGLDDTPAAPTPIGTHQAPRPGRRVDVAATTSVRPDINNHAARMARRVGFLADVLQLSDDAAAYRPPLASDGFYPSWAKQPANERVTGVQP